jgi:hypothetical protein
MGESVEVIGRLANSECDTRHIVAWPEVDSFYYRNGPLEEIKKSVELADEAFWQTLRRMVEIAKHEAAIINASLERGDCNLKTPNAERIMLGRAQSGAE